MLAAATNSFRISLPGTHSSRCVMKKLFALLILAFVGVAPVFAAERGLLLIDVFGIDLNNRGDVIPRAGWPARSYNVLNLETKKLVTNFFPNARVWAVELDEGIYCLEAIKIFDNVQIDYCGEPYFRVVGGRLNNAGRWVFGVSKDFKQRRLVSSLQDLDKTLAEARRLDESLLNKYAPAQPDPSASDTR